MAKRFNFLFRGQSFDSSCVSTVSTVHLFGWARSSRSKVKLTDTATSVWLHAVQAREVFRLDHSMDVVGMSGFEASIVYPDRAIIIRGFLLTLLIQLTTTKRQEFVVYRVFHNDRNKILTRFFVGTLLWSLQAYWRETVCLLQKTFWDGPFTTIDSHHYLCLDTRLAKQPFIWNFLFGEPRFSLPGSTVENRRRDSKVNLSNSCNAFTKTDQHLPRELGRIFIKDVP